MRCREIEKSKVTVKANLLSLNKCLCSMVGIMQFLLEPEAKTDSFYILPPIAFTTGITVIATVTNETRSLKQIFLISKLSKHTELFSLHIFL